MSGGRRSEVKEEGRAQPGPGDMSGVGHPAALARSDADHKRQQGPTAAKTKMLAAHPRARPVVQLKRPIVTLDPQSPADAVNEVVVPSIKPTRDEHER